MGSQLSYCGDRVDPKNEADIALLGEIADTILPAPEVPGVKAAKTGDCMATLVCDCFEPEEQELFTTGLAGLLAAYEKRFGSGFIQGKPADRLVFLNEYNRVVPNYRPRAFREKESPEWQCFRHVKQLTILGYFTSEIGCTLALLYAEVPGGYDGNALYKPGDRNWFVEVR